MLVKEAISRVRNTLKEYIADSRLSSRYVWNVIWTTSSYLIEKEKGLHNLDIFKPISLDTEEVNKYEGSCVPLSCIVCRVKLPSGVEGKKGLIYRYIGSPDLSTTFKLVSPLAFGRKKKIRMNAQNYAFLEEGYIYLDECFPCVKVAYFPNDSDEALDSTSGCSKLDRESPVPDYLLHAIFKMSFEELTLHARIPFDHLTNKNRNQ